MPINEEDNEITIKCQRYCSEDFASNLETEYVDVGGWMLLVEKKNGYAFDKHLGVRLCL